MVFKSYGTRVGYMDGLPVSSPYLTKDYLQLKRCKAQLSGTTYVYDFPDMFKQNLVKRKLMAQDLEYTKESF